MKKFIVSVSAVALALAFTFNVAAAQTVTTTTTTTSSAFTRNLTIGSTGADVSALQALLIAGGKLQIAAPTGYFGAMTKAALASWQASVGITPASGYFGPKTRAYVATMGGSTTGGSTVPGCVAGAMFSSTTGAPCSGSTSGSSSSLNGGEASLEDFDLVSEDDAEEGESKVEVATARFYARDADAKLDRADFEFESTGTGSTDNEPWKVFEKAYLMMDGKTIATKDVDNEDDWSDEGSDVYRVRFTGLNSVVKEDKRAEITLALDVMDNIDDADNASWEVTVADEGIRAIDGAGIDQYTGDAADTVAFDINVAGENDDLTFRESSDNPSAQTFRVDADQTSDWATVLKFEAEADDSGADVQIKKLPITIDFSNSETYAQVVNDAKLVIDGEDYNDFEVATSTNGSAVLVFDLDNGDDVIVDAGETLDFEFALEFKKTTQYNEGTTVTANLTAVNVNNVDAEGADDLDQDALKGSVDGEAFTLRTSGVTVEKTAASATSDAGLDTTTTDDQGMYTISFDVTGFEEDTYVQLTAGQGSTTGATFRVENSSNIEIASTTGTTTAALELVSGGSQTGNYVRISDGQVAKFKLTVNFDPATTAFYRVQLVSVNTNTSASAPNVFQNVGPEEEFQTNSIQVRN